MFQKDLFGARLKKCRLKSGETQAEIAQLLGISGNQVSEMESGKKTTSFERLCLLCDHFNVSADYLLGRTEAP